MTNPNDLFAYVKPGSKIHLIVYLSEITHIAYERSTLKVFLKTGPYITLDCKNANLRDVDNLLKELTEAIVKWRKTDEGKRTGERSVKGTTDAGIASDTDQHPSD